MFLLLLCSLLNYHGGLAQEFPAEFEEFESALQEPTDDKHSQDLQKLIRELKEKVKNSKSGRRSIEPNFEIGLLDYDITPIDFLGTAQPKHVEQIVRENTERTIPPAHHEDFLDYDITNMFWTSTPKIDAKITPPKFYIQTPAGYGKTSLKPETKASSTSDPWDKFELPEHQTDPNLSSLDDLFNHHVDELENSTTPVFTPFLYNVSIPIITKISRPTYPFYVPTSTASIVYQIVNATTRGQWNPPLDYDGPPATLNSSLTIRFPDAMTKRTTFPTTRRTTTTTESTTVSTSPRPPIPIPRFQSVFAFTSGARAKFFTVVTKSSSKDQTTLVDKSLMHFLNVSRVTPMTQKTPSKVKAWGHDRQWGKASTYPSSTGNVTRDKRTKSLLRETFLPTEPTEPPEASTSVANNPIVVVDDLGALHVSTPEAIPEVDPFDENSTTTAGDILDHAFLLTSPSTTEDDIHIYEEQMEKHHEGYMGLFLIELARLLSVKEDKHVLDIVMNAEFIIVGYIENRTLLFLGEQLGEKAQWVGTFFSQAATNMHDFKTFMTILHRMIKERRTAWAEDTNKLFDRASSFYNQEEGEDLLHSLRDVHDYPNVTLTSYEVCHQLIDDFLRPFIRLSETQRCQDLVRAIEDILEDRFGVARRLFREELFKLTAKGPNNLRENQNQPSDPLNSREPKSSFKQLIALKRRNRLENRRRRLFVNLHLGHVSNPMLRNLLPITSNQKRFRVVSQRHRSYMDHVTGAYAEGLERVTRNDKPYNGMMQKSRGYRKRRI